MKRKFPLVITLLIIILFHAICNYIWLKNDDVPLWFDYGAYFNRSIHIFKTANKDFGLFIKSIIGLGEYVDSYHPYRILLPLVSVPFYYLFGISEDIAVMTMMFSFIILILSTYGIGKQICDWRTGLFSAFIVSIYPGISWFSRHYSPEFVCIAVVALSIYFLIKTDCFKNKRYSLLLGVSLAAGMLSKEMYFVFIIGPMAYSIFKILYRSDPVSCKRKEITNYFLSVGIGIVVVSIWYIPHVQSIASRLSSVAYSHKVRIMYNMPELFSWGGFGFYFINSIKDIMSTFFFLIFVLALIILVKKRNRWMHGLSNKNNIHLIWILILWVVVSYTTLTFTPTKAIEYFLPAIPVFAICTSLGILMIRNRTCKIATVFLIISLGLFQHFSCSFGFANRAKSILNRKIPVFCQQLWMHPQRGNWRTKEVLEYINKQNRKNRSDKVTNIAIIPNTEEVSGPVFIYYNTMLGFNLQPFWQKINLASEELDSVLRKVSFIISKNGGNQGYFVKSNDVKRLLTKIKDYPSFIKLDQEFVLPDKSSIEIYMKKSLYR